MATLLVQPDHSIISNMVTFYRIILTGLSVPLLPLWSVLHSAARGGFGKMLSWSCQFSPSSPWICTPLFKIFNMVCVPGLCLSLQRHLQPLFLVPLCCPVSWSQTACVQIKAPSHACCVTLTKLLNHFLPPFPHPL